MNALRIIFAIIIITIISVPVFSQFDKEVIGGVFTPEIIVPYIDYENPNEFNKNLNNIGKNKVKSITKATNYYRKGKYEDTLYYEDQFEYDTNGNVIKWKYLDKFVTYVSRHGDFSRDPLDSIYYFYNSNNLISDKLAYHKAYYVIHKHEYDSNNNLLSIGKIYDSLSIDDQIFFEFDKKGNLTKEKKYWDYKDDTIAVVYERQDYSKLTCKSVYPDRDIKILWDFKYSKNKDTVFFTEYNEWIFGKEYLFKSNRLSKVISNSTVETEIKTFLYNDKNQLVKEKTQIWGWNRINYYNYPDKTWYDEYKYNSNGLLDEILHYYSNWMPSSKTKFIYEYYE